MRLHYVHDPMCSWCWAFRPAFERLLAALPRTVAVQRVLGGLAPDDEAPMPEAMRESLQMTWRRIEQSVPGTRFDFAFWSENVPRRSTFRACRAVIAAREQDATIEAAMIEAIQRAYYLQARNPSDRDVLIDLARELGCDEERFADALDDRRLHLAHERERALAGALGVRGFPSLVLVSDEADAGRVHARHIPVDHRDHLTMLDVIERHLAA